MNKIQVCCEALILRERHEAYKFMLNSAFDMNPKVEKKNIQCIYFDYFFNNSLLHNTGLSHV